MTLNCREALRSVQWLNPMEVNINVKSQRPSALVTDRHNKIEHLKHVSNIIAVSRLAFPFVVMNSCKGGVGKSTVAVNLALAYRFSFVAISR